MDTPAFGRLALHTWSLDTTPLPQALAAARDAGFDALEIRRLDYMRRFALGEDTAQVHAIIRDSGLPVCTLGCEYGWIMARGEESRRLFAGLEQTCRDAVDLGCPMVMSAPGQVEAPVAEAIANLRTAGDICAEHGLTLAIEFNSQHPIINCVETLREIIDGADRPNVGMLLDAYHLHRSGRPGRGFADVAPHEIMAFQYSDVPAAPVPDGVRRPTDRLLPGDGVVPFAEVFALLAEKQFFGHLSFEAPNPVLWAQDPLALCRTAVERSRALI